MVAHSNWIKPIRQLLAFFIGAYMPYKIIEENDNFKVVNETTNAIMGLHKTQARAKAQLAALYANEPEASKSMKIGARNSTADAARIQQLHDLTVELGAECNPEELDEIPTEDEMVESSKALNLSYAKSIGCMLGNNILAIKSIGADSIVGYMALWGNEKVTDIESEYFTKNSDFWDKTLAGTKRPLTWDHAQDVSFKADPVIGAIEEFGDDDIGRWFNAKLDRSHRYRKAIDALIEQGKLGASSDSAPQYVERVKTGKSTWLKRWPMFAVALTDTPAEPRMIGTIDYLKSCGVLLPDNSIGRSWEWLTAQNKRLHLVNY